jgi:hypothetical protein
MKKTTESRIYLAAFAITAIVTVIACTWMDGAVTQWDHDRHQLTYWESKYEALAGNTDGDAGAKFARGAGR